MALRDKLLEYTGNTKFLLASKQYFESQTDRLPLYQVGPG